MKYGTVLVILAFINGFTVFSGLPSGWKQIIITVSSVFIVFIGWIIRSYMKRKVTRTHSKRTKISEPIHEINQSAPLNEATEELINQESSPEEQREDNHL